jgi:hypothetical protein
MSQTSKRTGRAPRRRGQRLRSASTCRSELQSLKLQQYNSGLARDSDSGVHLGHYKRWPWTKQTLWQHCGRGTRTSARHETSPLINADSDALIGATAAVQNLNTTYTKLGKISSRGRTESSTPMSQVLASIREIWTNRRLGGPRTWRRHETGPEYSRASDCRAGRGGSRPGACHGVCACYRVHACTCQCAV